VAEGRFASSASAWPRRGGRPPLGRPSPAPPAHHAYLAACPPVRRLINQAFFQALYINDDDTIRSELAEPFAILLGDELTQEAEATLAQEAKDPSSNAGTTGPTSTSEPHTQDVKASNKAPLVEVMGFEPTTSSMRPKRSRNFATALTRASARHVGSSGAGRASTVPLESGENSKSWSKRSAAARSTSAETWA
jgi:hypothetical protein